MNLTNASALSALATLRSRTDDLNTVTKAVQTGYRVADASDDGAVFAIAQGVRADIKTYAAIQSSLSSGVNLGELTLKALGRISDLTGDIRVAVGHLYDGSLTQAQRQLYADQVHSLAGQIGTTIQEASYNGKNLLDGDAKGGTPLTVSYALDYVADTSGKTLGYRARFLSYYADR
jgi:flagellin